MKRADLLLTELALAKSRSQAADLIAAGKVFFRENPVEKPSQKLPPEAKAEDFEILQSSLTRFVSRGGLKLEGALQHCDLNVAGFKVLDVGQSTGGFTDCLLQAGVSLVVGIDVGHGQLDSSLAQNPRVKAYEGLHVKDLTPEIVGEVHLCVVDVSFISLTRVLPYLVAALPKGCLLLSLVKPQFEVGPEGLGKGGLVKNKELYEEVKNRVLETASSLGMQVRDFFESPVKGKDGNVEFFIFASCG